MAAPNIDDIPGWLTQKEADELNRLAAGRDVLEVGSFCGRSTVALASSAAAVVCVDPFDGRATPYPQDTLPRFLDTIRTRGLTDKVTPCATTIEKWTEETAQRVFGLVFIDAEHTAEAVRTNLEAVHYFASLGGVVALHDYKNPDYPGVKAAADSVFHRTPDRLIDSLAVYLMDGPYPGRILNVVTPSMRPGNLRRVSESLYALRHDLPGWWVRWYVGVDRSIDYVEPVPGATAVYRQSPVGAMGNPGRNDALDMIRAGWVHFLDDDNDIHPQFASGLKAAVAEYPDADGYVFPQFNADGGPRLEAKVDAGHGSIDSAQFVFRRSVIGGTRWKLDDYAADADFFRTVAPTCTVVPIPSGGVYYNKLRG